MCPIFQYIYQHVSTCKLVPPSTCYVVLTCHLVTCSIPTSSSSSTRTTTTAAIIIISYLLVCSVKCIISNLNLSINQSINHNLPPPPPPYYLVSPFLPSFSLLVMCIIKEIFLMTHSTHHYVCFNQSINQSQRKPCFCYLSANQSISQQVTSCLVCNT